MVEKEPALTPEEMANIEDLAQLYSHEFDEVVEETNLKAAFLKHKEKTAVKTVKIDEVKSL